MQLPGFSGGRLQIKQPLYQPPTGQQSHQQGAGLEYPDPVKAGGAQAKSQWQEYRDYGQLAEFNPTSACWDS